MSKFFIIALLFSLSLAKEGPAITTTEPTLSYYHDDELITKFNTYREKYANMYKDIEIDVESQESSLAELKRLLNDIDTFGNHVDFESTYKNTYNSPSQFCEFICKLHEEYPSNQDRCIELWDEAPEYREHMRLEYATGGSTCTKYGNGVLCVMHVREGTGSGSTSGQTEQGLVTTAKTSAE